MRATLLITASLLLTTVACTQEEPSQPTLTASSQPTARPTSQPSSPPASASPSPDRPTKVIDTVATGLEAPWGIASCLMNSRGGQTPWRVALRTPSFANVSALGRALEGAQMAQIPDVVASLGYTIGDLDK